MPKYVVECDSGFCGVNEIVIVEADCESEAEQIAGEWWDETVSPSVEVREELTEDNAHEYDGCTEIN